MLIRPLSTIACFAVLVAGTSAAPAQGQSKAAPKAAAAAAQPSPTPKSIGSAQGWTAYTYPVNGGVVCYAVGEPTKKEPATARRDRVDALVTHNTAEKTTNVISFVAGYAFADKAEVELDVDGKKFKLFTNADTAWARDTATDKAVTDALAKGKQAVVKGSSARGTATTDTYSLAGFTQVLGLIDKACNVKR
jgi:hypothetical protein